MQKRIILRLTDDMEKKIRELVKSGKFKSISQVTREALLIFLKENGD